MENLAYFLIGVGNPLHSIYVGTSNFTVAKELFPSNQSDSVRHSFDRRLVYLGLSATPVLPWWGGGFRRVVTSRIRNTSRSLNANSDLGN